MSRDDGYIDDAFAAYGYAKSQFLLVAMFLDNGSWNSR